MIKIGIVTFHNAINYGAVLQAYALQTFLIKNNYDCVVIDYNNDFITSQYMNKFYLSIHKSFFNNLRLIKAHLFHFNAVKLEKQKTAKILNFIEKHMKLTEKYDKKSIVDTNTLFDVFITGSDQVFNMRLSDNDENYLLSFVKSDKKKISYAASFGTECVPEQYYQIYKRYLKDFSSILVREASAVNFIKTNFEYDANVVIDPTLLITKNDWVAHMNLTTNSKVTYGNYILIYLVATPNVLLEKAIKYAQINNYKIISIGNIKNKFINVKIIDASIYDFLNLVLNAQAVFTTSYHGIMFSVNFNVNFYYELSTEIVNNNDRIIDFMSRITANCELSSNSTTYNEFNWSIINNQVESQRKSSVNLLKQSIERESIEKTNVTH